MRSPCQTTPLIKGTRHSAGLFPSRRLQFSASLRNYSNKIITSSCGNQRAPHTLDAPLAHGLLLCSRVQPSCGPARRVVFFSSVLCVYVPNNLLLVSSAQGQVLCVFDHPWTLGQEPLSPTDWIGGDWNKRVKVNRSSKLMNTFQCRDYILDMILCLSDLIRNLFS